MAADRLPVTGLGLPRRSPPPPLTAAVLPSLSCPSFVFPSGSPCLPPTPLRSLPPSLIPRRPQSHCRGGGQGGGLVCPHGVPMARLCPSVAPLPSGLGPACPRGFRLPLGGFQISFACVPSGSFPGTSKPPSSLLVSRRAPPAGSWLSAILVPPFSHLPHSISSQSLLAAFSCACTATSRHAFLTQARGHPSST